MSLDDQIEQLNEQLASETEARSNYVRQMISLNQLNTAQAKNQIDTYNANLKSLKAQIKEVEAENKRFKEAVEASKKAFLSFGEALANTSNDLSKFSPSVSNLTKGFTLVGSLALANATGISKATPLFVNSVNFATQVLSTFAESLIKYTETIVKTYDSTASIGAAAGITASELERLGRDSRFSGDDLKVFGDIVKKQGSTLVAFGGGVSEGVRSFANYINVGEDQLKKYRMLGISQTQLAEYQGQYADSLIRSGTSIDRSAEGIKKLRESSLEYRDILYSLSTITGDSLEQQQKAIDFQNSQSNVQASYAQRDMERRELQARLQDNLSEQEKASINERLASLDKTDVLMRAFAQFADPAKIGTEHATAFSEAIASGGTVMTESISKLAMMGYDINGVIQQLQNFDGSVEEGIQVIARSMLDYGAASDEFIARSGQMATDFGAVSQEYIKSVSGQEAASLQFAARMRQISFSDLITQLSKAADGTTDPILDLQSESEELARNFRDISSAIKATFIPALVGFMGKTFETMNFISDKIDKITGKNTEENDNEPSVIGALGVALAGILGPIGTYVLGKKAIRGIQNVFSPAATTTTSGMNTAQIAQYRALRSQNIPASQALQQVTGRNPLVVGGSPSGAPISGGGSPRTPTRWTRFVSTVGKRLGPRAAAKIAVSAGLMAIPGPGWIMALINLGLNATTAWAIYQIWKEVSGSSEENDDTTETSTPIAGISAATNELAQSLALLTGTETEVGTVPRLTNSFDSLINATNLLTMSFSNLSNLSSNRNTPSNTVGSMTEQQIKDYIIKNEGIRYDPYLDTEGNWTVGVGHNLGKQLSPEMNRTFTHQEVMELFEQDYREHRIAAERIPGFNSMDSSGQMALTDMTFNMGPSWIREWPELQNQLAMGDTTSAANNLRSSLYYNQVGSRGERNAQLLQSARPDFDTIDSNTYLTAVADNSSVNTQTSDVTTVSKLNEVLSINRTLMEMLNSKMDNMIGKLDESNYIQGRILSNTV